MLQKNKFFFDYNSKSYARSTNFAKVRLKHIIYKFYKKIEKDQASIYWRKEYETRLLMKKLSDIDYKNQLMKSKRGNIWRPSEIKFIISRWISNSLKTFNWKNYYKRRFFSEFLLYPFRSKPNIYKAISDKMLNPRLEILKKQYSLMYLDNLKNYLVEYKGRKIYYFKKIRIPKRKLKIALSKEVSKEKYFKQHVRLLRWSRLKKKKFYKRLKGFKFFYTMLKQQFWVSSLFCSFFRDGKKKIAINYFFNIIIFLKKKYKKSSSFFVAFFFNQVFANAMPVIGFRKITKRRKAWSYPWLKKEEKLAEFNQLKTLSIRWIKRAVNSKRRSELTTFLKLWSVLQRTRLNLGPVVYQKRLFYFNFWKTKTHEKLKYLVKWI